MNRNARRSWDRYVAEAREVRSEVDLPGEKTITVFIPTAEQINQLNAADVEGDIWKQLEALMGAGNVKELRKHAADAPVTALTSLLEDILLDLGLREGQPRVDTGNSDASSS